MTVAPEPSPMSAAAQMDSRFLDRRALDSLRHMRFVPRQRVEGGYSGRHRSRQRGGAAEFVDYRQYNAGEDLRHLDWKVLARTERQYVRVYQDETNLRCLLMLDGSRSMDFGPRPGLTKLEYVQSLATAISQLVVDQQDQVGLAIAADGLREIIPPAGTQQHARRVQSAIEELVPRPASRLDQALDELYARSLRRGTLLIMSDFLVDDADALFAKLRLFRQSRWDVLLLHVIHPLEERLPAGLAWRFEGLEDDGAVDCSPAEVATAYEQAFEAHGADIRLRALAVGCGHRRLVTSTHYVQALASFLVHRHG